MTPQLIMEGILFGLTVSITLFVVAIALAVLIIWIDIKWDVLPKKPPLSDEERGFAKFTPDGCAYLDLKDPRTLAKLWEVIEDFNKPKSLDDFNLPEDIKRDIKRHRYTREEINANWEKAKKMIEEERKDV